MKTFENNNEVSIGLTALSEWTAPEIKILDSEYTESAPSGKHADGIADWS